MTKRPLEMPQFKTESEEADWWASPAGRSYVKRKSAGGRLGKALSSNKQVRPLPDGRGSEPASEPRASASGLLDRQGYFVTAPKNASSGSSLVATLNKKTSVQIALRLPEADLVQARKIAEGKGIGYQTLLKMYVREGLMRESPRRKSPR